MAVSTDPSWAETSVLWLRSYYPHFAGFRLGATALQELDLALARMNYLEAEIETKGVSRPGAVAAEAKRQRAELIKSWGEAEHQEMVKFLREGGYENRRRVLSGEAPLPEPLALEDDDGKVIADGLEVRENGRDEPARREKESAEQQALERAERERAELEAAVAAELEFDGKDPEAGSW